MTKCGIKILHDSGTFQSVKLQDALPLIYRSFLGSYALVKGIGDGFLTLPLRKLLLDSVSVSGDAVVALSPQLPNAGGSLLLGNSFLKARFVLLQW